MTTADPFDATRLRGLVRLAGPTSHDIRGACGTMAVHLELLATAIGELPETEVSERLARYLAVLRREAQRALDLTQALLTVVAVPDDEPSQFDLGVLLHETWEALRPLATRRHTVLDPTRPSYPVPITGVRERVRQEVLDLVLPILDQAPSGSRLSLRLADTPNGATLAIERANADPVILTLPRREQE